MACMVYAFDAPLIMLADFAGTYKGVFVSYFTTRSSRHFFSFVFLFLFYGTIYMYLLGGKAEVKWEVSYLFLHAIWYFKIVF